MAAGAGLSPFQATCCLALRAIRAVWCLARPVSEVLPEPPCVPSLRQERGKPVVHHPVKTPDGVHEIGELKSLVVFSVELDQSGPPVLLPVFLQCGYVDKVAGGCPVASLN